MSKKKNKELSSSKLAYRKGYIAGFANATDSKMGQFRGSAGYNSGYKAGRKAIRIDKKVEKYERELKEGLKR